MADYFYSLEARLDLLEIWEYIAADHVDTADRVEQEIRQPILMLAANPGLGHRRRDLTSKPVRFWPVYSYLVNSRMPDAPLGDLPVRFRRLVYSPQIPSGRT